MAAIFNNIDRSSVLSEYANADIIFPLSWDKEDPVFVSKDQPDDTLENLALTYSVIDLEFRPKMQLYEVPNICEDCREYCGRGFSKDIDQPNAWSSDGWIRLADSSDFICRNLFEKVFVYGQDNDPDASTHYTRMWGDGSILSKMGSSHFGATPVIRVTDPNHPYIVRAYGKVQAVWIRKASEPLPLPYYRSPSTYIGALVPGGTSQEPLYKVKNWCLTPFEPLYQALVKKRNNLQKDAVDHKSNE